MNFRFPSEFPFLAAPANKNAKTDSVAMKTSIEKSAQRSHFDIAFWGWSLLSLVPWFMKSRERESRLPSAVNKELTKHVRSNGVVGTRIGYSTIRFRPYVSKVPWHTGARAFLSHLFPRYGNYCGPNWSSGKAGGSHIWDKRPIDWLDFCCYCHDIGYDTHDQAELLKADLAFLECLERPQMKEKGDARAAYLYKTMCISGLRNILIPYREQLLKLQSGKISVGFGWLSNMKWKGWGMQRTSSLDL